MFEYLDKTKLSKLKKPYSMGLFCLSRLRRGVSTNVFLTMIILGVSLDVYAVEVAFFRQYTPSGELVKYEAGGEFAHIAISYRGKWLHAHPYGGVQLSDRIDAIGFLDYVILENKAYPEPTSTFVRQQLQKTFDIFAVWSDPLKTYCSKLVAEFFGIRPELMRFSSQNWQGFQVPKGLLGLSPDDVYRDLIQNKDFVSKDLSPERAEISFSTQTKDGRRCVGFLRATI